MGDVVVLLQLVLDPDDVLQLLEEPAVDLRQLVDALDGVPVLQRVRDDEDALVGRMGERGVDVVDLELLVRDEAVHALSDHPQALLDHFLEVTADGHHLADRLHARSQLARDALELAQVPARYLADDIVERRLEAGRRALGHVVLQLVQTVAEAELRGYERERVAGGLGRQRRRAAQTRVDLDHAVVLRVRVEGVLHVALADHADVADDLDRQLAQLVVLGVRQRLRRGDDDALAGVDAQRVEVLHVADRDAVVVAVAHDLVLDLLPALERLFDEYLRRVRERLVRQRVQLLVVVAEARSESAERIGRADNDRVAQFVRDALGLGHRRDGLALDRLHVDLVEFLDEFLPVLRVDDRLYGRTHYLHAVFFEHAAAVELHAAVQGRLAAEREQDALRALLLDYLLDVLGRDGQEINLVGDVLRSLDRSDVRVDEHRVDAFLLERLERLRARVVEFPGLADLKRSRPEQDHFLYLVYFLHFSMFWIKSSNRNSVSTGPPEASGWNCTEKNGFVRCRMPSLVPSLRFTK